MIYKYKDSPKEYEVIKREIDIARNAKAIIKGNVYEGVAGTIYISNNYNYFWFPAISPALMTYEYKDGRIEAYDSHNSITYISTVAEGGKTIITNVGGTDYTFELTTDTVYSPEYLESQGVYDGIYYNSENKKFAWVAKRVREDGTMEAALWFKNEEWGFDAPNLASTYANISNEGKTIQYKELDSSLEYTLLEAGEF